MRVLSAREQVVLAAALVALLANAALTLGNVRSLVAVQSDAMRAQQALTELARLEGTLLGAESAQRRFLLAGGAGSLAPLEAARTVLGIQLDRLRELTREDAGQAARLAELGLVARRRIAELTEEVRLHRSRPPLLPAPLAPAPPATDGSAVRTAVDALEAVERDVLASKEAAGARRRFGAVASGVATTLLGLALVAVALLLLRREFAGREAAAAALEEANESLRDVDRKKDEFLASLAHELRNPLAAMRSASDLLDAAADGEDAKAWERRALARSVLGRQLSHLTRLVDDLLDLARVTSSRATLRREVVTLADVVEAALETTRPAVEARRHALSVRLPEEPVLVEADPVRLAQVLSNLLTNAAKYSPPGGRIELSAAADELEAVVRVTDDGIGLAPRDLERVFGLFERGPGRAHAEDGLGVGLALSRRLAHLHGGSLTASSEGPGHGSTFTLRLPRASAPRRPPAPPGPPAPAPEARSVLLVEDNGDAARALAELLSAAGHDVHVAADGPSGLEAARRLRPDAVVLDLGLPGFDGYELARRVRADADLEGTLLVALSGWAGSDERSRATEAGIDHHLVKPAGVARLGELLATARRRPRT